VLAEHPRHCNLVSLFVIPQGNLVGTTGRHKHPYLSGGIFCESLNEQVSPAFVRLVGNDLSLNADKPPLVGVCMCVGHGKRNGRRLSWGRLDVRVLESVQLREAVPMFNCAAHPQTIAPFHR
jgi:hypothetical protein